MQIVLEALEARTVDSHRDPGRVTLAAPEVGVIIR